MSRGRLGPASGAPSCWRRRNPARPPGPDSSSTALPMMARSSASRARDPGPAVVTAVAARSRSASPASAPAASGSSASGSGPSRASSTHSRTSPSSAPGSTSPVTTGLISASHATAAAAGPSSQAAPSLPADRGGGAVPGPPGPDRGDPLAEQGAVFVEGEQLGQGHVHPGTDRLPGPLREQPGRQEPLHRLGQRVVVPLPVRPQVPGPGRGRQGVQHRADHRRALRGQVPAQDPGAFERGLQPDRPVREPVVRPVGVRRPGPRVDLGGQPGQVRQAGAGHRGRDQDRIRGVLAVRREQAGPVADGAGDGLRDLHGGQRGQDPRVGPGPPGPGQVGGRGTLGDPEPGGQPGLGAVAGVFVVALPVGERPQYLRPRRGLQRVGLLQDLQQLRLRAGRQLRRVQRGQVTQPAADRFGDGGRAGEFWAGIHRGVHLPARCAKLSQEVFLLLRMSLTGS